LMRGAFAQKFIQIYKTFWGKQVCWNFESLIKFVKYLEKILTISLVSLFRPSNNTYEDDTFNCQLRKDIGWVEWNIMM
jgi:hypothetical protein